MLIGLFLLTYSAFIFCLDFAKVLKTRFLIIVQREISYQCVVL